MIAKIGNNNKKIANAVKPANPFSATSLIEFPVIFPENNIIIEPNTTSINPIAFTSVFFMLELVLLSLYNFRKSL